MKVHLIVIAVLLLPFSSFAQKEKREKKDPWTSTELWIPVPINRQLWHDKIDKIQLAADEFDHTKDGRITVKGDTASSDKLTDALLRHVDQLQQIIENLPLDHFKKIAYLTELQVSIKEFTFDQANGKVDAELYTNTVDNYETLIKKRELGGDILDDINANFSFLYR